MNSETLFSMALGMQTPWQVKDVTFSTNESGRSELHLGIGFAPGSRFPDESNNLYPVHDTVERQRQHLSFSRSHAGAWECGEEVNQPK